MNVCRFYTYFLIFKWNFKVYDADGSGTLERDELVFFISRVYQSTVMDNQLIGNVPLTTTTTEKYDLINFQIEDLSEEESIRKAEILFSKIDINNEGYVTEEEFVAVCLGDPDLVTVMRSQADD